MGNSLIARNWFVLPATAQWAKADGCPNFLVHPLTWPLSSLRRNKKETLSQNYRRLGLTAKLGKATGGIENLASAKTPTPTQDPLAVTPASGMRGAVSSVRVERDADGNIVRVLRKENPLNDPLNDLDSDEDEEGSPAAAATAAAHEDGEEEERERETKVVDLLERQANAPTEKHIRHMSAREREWVERLVAKHGDDTAAMARDFKLNPMQQTEGDIKRRLKSYKEKMGE